MQAIVLFTMQEAISTSYGSGELARSVRRNASEEGDRVHSSFAAVGGLPGIRRLAAAILQRGQEDGQLAVEFSATQLPATLSGSPLVFSSNALLTFADAERDAAPRMLPRLRCLFSDTLPRLRFFTAVPVMGDDAESGEAMRLGSLFVGDTHASCTLAPDQEEALLALGRQVGTILSLESHKRRLEAEVVRLSALATTDGLTALANRRSFNDRLSGAIIYARQTETPLSLILLDVDRFKHYNDMYGHPAGDEVLRQVGRVLMRVARDSDIPARYGGEEFAVLLPETDGETGSIIADLFRGEIEAASFPHREVTASFGVAELTPFMQANELVTAADTALYRSKEAGRNCVTLADADI